MDRSRWFWLPGIAALLSYGVARWQLATRTEGALIASMGAAVTFALVVRAWSGVS